MKLTRKQLAVAGAAYLGAWLVLAYSESAHRADYWPQWEEGGWISVRAGWVVVVLGWLWKYGFARGALFAGLLVIVGPLLHENRAFDYAGSFPYGMWWMILLAGCIWPGEMWREFYEREQLPILLTSVACVLIFLIYRGDSGSEVPAGSVTEFWHLVPGDASLRAALVAYVVEGAVYLFTGVGAWFAAIGRMRAAIPPALMVATTWLLNASVSANFTPALVFPILALFAAMGIEEVYVRLGRTGGHGILAIDAVRDKPRPRPSRADG